MPAEWTPNERQQLSVRTESRPLQLTAPGVDPRDIEVAVGADQLVVTWTNQEPYLYGSAYLFALDAGGQLLQGNWWKSGESRIGTIYDRLGGHHTFRLYVSLRASEPLGDGSGYPHLCVVRDVRLPPGGPEAYFDRYFFASTQEQLPAISPGPTPEVTVGYRFRFHYMGACHMAWNSCP